MAELKYTTRSIRQRGAKEMWGITLSHKNPITGETVRTYHKVEAKTRKQAEKKRDELILDLKRKSGARELFHLVIRGEVGLLGLVHDHAFAVHERKVDLAIIDLGVGVGNVDAGALLVAELVALAREQIYRRVEPHLQHLHNLGEPLQNAVAARRIGVGVVVEHAFRRGGDEQVAAPGGNLRLVHPVGHVAQTFQDIYRARAVQALACLVHALVPCDLRERERVGFRRNLSALQLRPASTKQSLTPASSTSMTSAIRRMPRSWLKVLVSNT